MDGTWKITELQNVLAVALHMSIVGVESGMLRDSDGYSAWKRADAGEEAFAMTVCLVLVAAG
jgi:hypothetical protein